MLDLKPSQSLKRARQDFKNLPADVCDELLEAAFKSDKGIRRFVAVPNVPAKYRNYMRSAWIVMLCRVLFENAKHKYSLQQRHDMLQKSL